MTCTTYGYSYRIGRLPRYPRTGPVRRHLLLTVKSQLGGKHHQMTIAQWNVRILLDRETTNIQERRTSLIAMELAKYDIDIAVLSQIRFHASGSLNDLDYTFYWSGQAKR